MSKAFGTILMRVTLAVLILTPAVVWAQQTPVKQKRNSQNQQNGISTNLSVQPNPMSSPLLRNPEGLTPVLSLGPLPRNNGSPQFTSDTAYMNTQINQQIIPLANQYINMQQNMAGGNGPPGSSQTGNGSSVPAKGTGVNGKQQGKNARGLAAQKQGSQGQEAKGAHANPGQGQGQTP
ncbi:MAG TPA: hypothetical protein VMT20_09730 [Terriglobia bacterium]|nr:hypothetical protein [Terriglobia bacterium]